MESAKGRKIRVFTKTECMDLTLFGDWQVIVDGLMVFTHNYY